MASKSSKEFGQAAHRAGARRTAGGASNPVLALREQREATIEALSQHFVEDALDLDAFEARLNQAHRATTAAELEALLADLEAPEEEPLELPPVEAQEPLARASEEPDTAPTPPASAAIQRPRNKSAVAVLGNVERKGTWTVPRKLSAVSVLGSVRLDLREVTLPEGTTESEAIAVLGEVHVIVPPHLAVSSEGIAIAGSFEHLERASAAPDPGRPLLLIKGVTVLGNVRIETRVHEGKRLGAGRPQKALGPGAG